MKLSLMILWEKVFLGFVSMRERHLITEAPGRRKQRDGIWNVVTLITNNNENGMKGENYINYYTWMFKKEKEKKKHWKDLDFFSVPKLMHQQQDTDAVLCAFWWQQIQQLFQCCAGVCLRAMEGVGVAVAAA